MALALTKEIKLLTKHSLVYSFGNFMQRIVSILLLPVYTKFLTPHDYGIKELVGLSTDVIAILIATAIAGAFYRFYFLYEGEKERSEVISTSLVIVGSVGLVTVGILGTSTRFMAAVILDDPELYHFFLIAFATLWFQALNDISFNVIKANQQSLKFVGLSLAKLVLQICLNIYFVCVLRIGVLGILLSSLIAAIVISGAATAPILARVGLRFSRRKAGEMLRFGFPLVPSQFGAFIVHLSDRFFIKEYCSIAEAGIYSLGYRFGALPGNFISDPFNQIFQPRRLQVYQQENSEVIFGRIFSYFLLVMCFAGLLVSVLAREVIVLMADREYWSAYQIVPIIVLATTIYSFHYHLNIGIIVANKTKYLAYINFSNGIAVLIMNFLLIPAYGVYGAAYATLIAFVYKVTLTYYISRKFFKVHFEFARVVKLIAVSAGLLVCAQLIEIDSVAISFAAKLLLVLIGYPLGVSLARFFSSDEWQQILGFVRTRSASHAA